ncbi:hypothetical protein [Roseofilum capinflatum]|uniref:Novel toxin 11 domain-containing protein n=1 Tax=Roseofilum capinflatum BLCC-M114 TaxID=3022440 RepID=A0ABT7B111_9CYAN|nr:hypothetical protein [Roseofilum capinflatum]MDJ1172859.1 hypothetical protein [Roseofilum capinflatum BLCC-M114]
MSPRRRQTKTRISRRKENPESSSPQFAAPPVIQPKAQRKMEKELPEWKPGGSGKPSPLQRLQPSATLQAKLEIGQPSDRYEQQADQVAHNVVQALHTPTAQTLDTQLTGQGKTAPTIQLEPTEYTVKNKTHLRDSTLKNKGTKYEHGQKVKISDNSMDHKKDRAGNIWFKVVDSDQYIRSTHLNIYRDKSLNWFSKRWRRLKKYVTRTKHPARKKYPDQTNIIDQLVKNAEKRDKDKGFLSAEELLAISTLSQDEQGKSFLLQKGFLTNDKLDKVAKEKKTTLDWHRTEKHRGLENLPLATGNHVFTRIHRLQIATYQRDLGISNPEYRQTLGYLRYEAEKAKTDPNVKQHIYEKDTQMWEQTLAPIPENALSQLGTERARQLREQTESAQNILRRIFIVLHSGLKYRDKEAEKIFKNDWPETVAVALSHGGRVMVKLPAISKGQDRNEFINWLLGNTSGEKDSKGSKKPNQVSSKNVANTDYGKAQVDTRNFSTHDIDIGTTETFKELKSGGNNSKGQSEEHYGMDIPLGGLGREDLAGEVTLPDGSHGHMYIFYEPPTLDKPGGLLIGAETSRMGRTDVYGQYHDAKGTSAEFSPTGTSKEAIIGDKIGGRIVDFTKGSYTEVRDKDGKVQQEKVKGGHTEVKDSNWLQQLKKAEQKIYEGQITAAELVGKTTPELKDKLSRDNKDRANAIRHKLEGKNKDRANAIRHQPETESEIE